MTHDLWYGQRGAANNGVVNNITNPPQWRVQSDRRATVRLRNQGAVEHDFTILKPGAEPPVPFRAEENRDLILFSTDEVERGETQEFALPDLVPGEYLVICSVLGHYPSMQGRLVVQ